jgi:t-SNARE complex subunit (syntaxin)
MNECNNEKLLGITSSLKNDVKSIQSKLYTHSLLIEAIDASNAENVMIMQDKNNKIEQAISSFKKDPRNKIICALVLIIILLAIYFFTF